MRKQLKLTTMLTDGQRKPRHVCYYGDSHHANLYLGNTSAPTTSMGIVVFAQFGRVILTKITITHLLTVS